MPFQVKYNTSIEYKRGESSVILSSIDCIGLDSNEEVSDMRGVQVSLQFLSCDGLFYLSQSSLKMTLLIYKLSGTPFQEETRRDENGTLCHISEIAQLRRTRGAETVSQDAFNIKMTY
jgi:hypothetical protein